MALYSVEIQKKVCLSATKENNQNYDWFRI
jgi:hypothetical protein